MSRPAFFFMGGGDILGDLLLGGELLELVFLLYGDLSLILGGESLGDLGFLLGGDLCLLTGESEYCLCFRIGESLLLEDESGDLLLLKGDLFPLGGELEDRRLLGGEFGDLFLHVECSAEVFLCLKGETGDLLLRGEDPEEYLLL